LSRWHLPLLFFALCYLISLCSPALPCPVRHGSRMPSLLNLGVYLLLRVAGLCDLKSAGYLSLVNKQVSAAVTPVLPALCALRLLLPFQDNVSLMHFSPTHEMWWALVFAKGDEYLQLAVSTENSDGQYYPAQYNSGATAYGLDIPFDKWGQYTPQKLRAVEEFTHAISGPYRPSELDQGVIRGSWQSGLDAIAPARFLTFHWDTPYRWYGVRPALIVHYHGYQELHVAQVLCLAWWHKSLSCFVLLVNDGCQILQSINELPF